MIQRINVLLLFAITILSCSCGSPSTPVEATSTVMNGQEIYVVNCKMCHGKDGGLGMGEARDLRRSELSTAEMIALVTNGKGKMAAYKDVLTQKQIERVVEYVRTLHTIE